MLNFVNMLNNFLNYTHGLLEPPPPHSAFRNVTLFKGLGFDYFDKKSLKCCLLSVCMKTKINVENKTLRNCVWIPKFKLSGYTQLLVVENVKYFISAINKSRYFYLSTMTGLCDRSRLNRPHNETVRNIHSQ